MAVIQYRDELRDYRAQGLGRQWSLTLTVAIVVALLGVYATGVLVARF